VLQLRNVGLFGALTFPPVTKIATKNEPCGNHCPPHVFLGAVQAQPSVSLRVRLNAQIYV
ncbi:MAG: hypothetical protein RBT65_19335, partial [Methanolobus sp.]|nr:hypothetical protein [Methanolobus sp.]